MAIRGTYGLTPRFYFVAPEFRQESGLVILPWFKGAFNKRKLHRGEGSGLQAQIPVFNKPSIDLDEALREEGDPAQP